MIQFIPFEMNHKMFKKISSLLALQLICSILVFGSVPKESGVCALVENLQEYLASEYMADGAALVYFNYSQGEFEEYVQINQITDFQIEIYGMSEDGSVKDLLQTREFAPDISIENWSMILTASEINNDGNPYDLLYALIYINGVDCGEGVVLDPEEYVEMGDLTCGENIEEDIDPDSPVGSIEIGETYTIHGFPFVATSLTEGKLSIPFGNSVVIVQFNNLVVNENNQVVSGSVIAVADDGMSYQLDRYAKRLKNGNNNEICIPPPPPQGYDQNGINTVTGLDDWGFDENGINQDTGTAYDKWGYDANGNHKDTGTPYNLDGCSREGLDEFGDDCELVTEVNPDAENFLDENAESISTLINGTLSNCTSDLEGAVETQRQACEALRIRMREIVALPQNGLPQELIFGTNDLYLKEGMSAHFSSPPEAIGEVVARNADVIELEQKHVDLYYCDLQFSELLADLSNVNNMPSDFEDQINEAITYWTEYEYQLYTNDPVKFEEWVKKQIETLAAGEEDDTGGNFTTQPEDELFDLENISEETLKQQVSDIFAYRKNVFGVEQPVYISEKKNTGELADLLTQYKKGNHVIDGIDRVYYTRQIHDKKLKSMDGDAHNILPLKLTNSDSDKPYDIYIERIEIGVSGASLDAVILIEDTKNGGHIVFRGENIGFGTGGLSGGADSYLRLDSEVSIRLNNAAKIHLLPEDTYVRWDCHGFQAIGVAAEIEFCPEFVKPVINGVVSETQNYRLAVQASEVSNWNDFHFSITAAPFVLTKYETIIWQLDALVADFSTTITEPTTTVPGYTNPTMTDNSGKLLPLWEGFYIQNLKATVPKDFSGTVSESSEVFEVAVNLAIIDDTGFTGEGSVTHTVVPLDEGNLNGWGFSIDEFFLRVTNNHFAGSGFGGRIQLPIIEDPMEYTAEIYPGDSYKFSVTPITNSESKLFNATLAIENSLVIVSKDQDGFHTFADVTGSIEFDNTLIDDSDFEGISLPSLHFSNFQISNEAPYFSPGIWDIQGNGIGVGFGGFRIELDNIKPYKPVDDETIGLGFNIALTLNDELNISARGGFGIVGELVLDANDRQKWQYKRLELHSLFVDAPIGTVAHVRGGIAFERNDDPLWGNYFQGALQVDLRKVAQTTITGIAQFGTKDLEKYFYVDLLVNLPVGIPAGPIEFTALGLGIYRNVTYGTQNMSIADILNKNVDDIFEDLPTPGASLSGGLYAFNTGVDFGIKGIAQFKTASERLLNGTVALGAEFSGSTIDRLYLEGSAQFLATIDSGILADIGEFVPEDIVDGELTGSKPSSVSVPLSAYVSLNMDFGNNAFTGDIGAYLDTPLLKGAGDNNALVLGKISFTPDNWHIKIGTPEQPAGIILSIPHVASVSATAYFQVGTDTDPMADIPSEVRAIAYSASRNQSLLTSGQGMVFGARLDIRGGIGLSGIVEAELTAIAGFDLMLRRYEGLSCFGQPGEIGIDGWYASGQLYALLEGSLEVFGIPLFSAGVAAILQAQLPNPFFAEATVAVSAKLLFITVNKSLSISLGEQCVLQADEPAAIFGADVIASISPGDNEQEVSVAVQPDVLLNFPLNRDVTMPSISGEDSKFKVKLKSVTLTGTSSGDIPSYPYVASDGMSISVNPIITLPANEEIIITAIVDLYVDGDWVGDQEKVISFHTGAELTVIPESNVKVAYPVSDMVNYYPNQYTSNMIQLVSGQPYLFNENDVRLYLSSRSSVEQEIHVSYEASQRKIVFNLPSELPAEVHQLELVEIKDNGDRHILYSISFTVSIFSKFSDKVNLFKDHYKGDGKFQIPKTSPEKLSQAELEEYVTGTFNISSSAESAFLSQFDQFNQCGICAYNVEYYINDVRIIPVIFSSDIIREGYQSTYAFLFGRLTKSQEDCIYELCGDVPDCDNYQLVNNTNQFVSNTKKNNARPQCDDISPFRSLTGNNLSINLTYQVPGMGSSYHSLPFSL